MNPLSVRPPYITFTVEPIERRDVAGNPLWVNVNFAHITQPGSIDTVDKIADEWIDYITRLAEMDPPAYPPEWITKIKARYELWKAGLSGPIDGTDIKNWPVATPAEVKNLTRLGILAVEDVANANEELVGRMGMGGRALKQKAIDYLQSQRDIAPLINELSAKDALIKMMEVRMKTLEAVVEDLRTRPVAPAAPAGEPPRLADLETRLAAAQDRVPAAEMSAVDDALHEELG